MNKFNFFLILIFINIQVFAQSQCPNSDFETGTLSGWFGETGWWGDSVSPRPYCSSIHNVGTSPGFLLGRQTIVTGPGTDPNTCNTVSIVAPGGLYSAQLGNQSVCFETETISYTIIPTTLNNLFIYKYAAVLQEPIPFIDAATGLLVNIHDHSEKPHFTISITDAAGNLIDPFCGYLEVYSDDNLPGWQTCPGIDPSYEIAYKDWTTVGLDLSPYVASGTPITIKFQTFDCARGGHFGYAYVDAYCTTLEIKDTYCNSNPSNPNATLTAPEGFSYLWSTGETTQQITIANPIPGDTYTCILISATSCPITLTKTLITPPVVTPLFTHTNCSNIFTFTNATTFNPPLASPTDTDLTIYIWNFGDGQTSNLENPIHTYDVPGNYTVTFTIKNITGTCSYTYSIPVHNDGKPIIAYSASEFCDSITTPQNVTLSPPIYTSGSYPVGIYTAVPSGLVLNSSTGAINPSLSQANTYTITYTIPAAGGCDPITSNAATVKITQLPTAVISSSLPSYCVAFQGTVPLILNGTGAYIGGSYTAVPPGLNLNPSTGAINPSLSQANTYTITYTTPAAGGCDEVPSDPITVTINPLIDPTFTQVSAICSGATLAALPTTSNNSITGTWSPAINNLATTTYTFTPTAGQCATTATMTITVYPMPVLQVASLSPLYYCDPNNDGFGVFDLTQVIPTLIGGVAYPVSFHETITDAQIHGTTIPVPTNYFNIHVDQQTIYIRVESLQSSNCFEIMTLDLIINPTPVATEPADYHVCDDNYDGFATFDLTSITPEVMGTINPTLNTISYYTSLVNAQNSINPISNLTNFINTTINTQTIWVRVETDATGCYDIVTIQLVVDPLPNATQPNYPPYTLCDNDQSSLGYETFDLGSKINDILLGQNGMSVNFYFSQADALSNSNPLPLLYVNSAIYVQTLWIRVENVFTGCFVLSTMDIRIEPLPSPIDPGPYIVCDSNQDGFASFDLNTLTTDILQGADYTITYHETLVDAQLGNNIIMSPYFNIIPFVQYLYVSAVDNVNGCRNTIQIELNVNPKPITPISIPNIIQCDEDNNPQNLSMVFDLTQNDAAVLAIQPLPASNYIVSYFISEPDAIDGTSPIIQSTSFVGFNNQIIWVRVEDTNTNCFAIGSFQLIVNAPLDLITPAPLSICDDDDILPITNNQYHVFDLTVRSLTINQGTTATVAYYPSLFDAQNNTNIILNPGAYTNILPGVQTLGVLVTNALGCRSYTTLDIRVLPIPTPRTNPPALSPKCDDNLPGDLVEIFDLTINEGYIANGDANLSFHYFPTQADAIANTNEILTPTAALVATNVWIRVENNGVDYNGNKCYVLVQQPLTVNPLPIIVQPLAPYRVCDDNADGIAVFDLTNPQLTLAVLGSSQLPVNFTVSYYLTAAGANPLTNTGETPLPSSYSNTSSPNTQTIYIRLVNNTTGCSSTGQLILTVNPQPTAIQPADFITCDSNADGYFTLDLSLYINGIIGTQTGVTTTFYNSQLDANTETNAIINLVNYQAYTQTVWIRVEDNLTGCYKLVPFNIIVEPLATPFITAPTNTICVEWGTNNLLSGVTLNSGITNPNYTFVWSLGGVAIPSATSSTYPINSVAAGDYTVVATSTPPLLGCISKPSNTFSVIQSGPPVFSTPPYTFSAAFDENQNITVNVVGYGVYEYSLDEGPFQASTIFTNVSAGAHTITVRDVEGITSCGQIFIDGVLIINYPHYFSPNGDGIHDFWNVTGLEDQPFARLYIFDRHGKLLKQLSTTSLGWDGNYTGRQLPSDDYWFKVEYLDQSGTNWKEFKAHFSLKR